MTRAAPAADVDRPTRGLDVQHRLRRLLESRFIPAVLVVYLLARVVSALMIMWVARHQDPVGIPGGTDHPGVVGYWDMTRIWDGEWYRRIAEQGYPSQLPEDETGTVQQNEWAFYPVFPMLVRLLMAATGGSFAVVGSLLALVCGAAAVSVMAVLLRDRVGAYGAFCAVAVFAVTPPSPTFQLVYTEAPALLLVVGFLLAISRSRWWVAAGLALLTGITRPIAAPLGLVALVAVVLRLRHRGEARPTVREYLAMAATLVSCGVSALIWPTYAGWVTGRASAYTDTMASWRAGGEIVPFRPWWDNFRFALGDTTGPLVVLLLVVIAVAAVAGPWARGLGPVLRTWTLGYLLYLGAVLDVWTSTYRYLLFAFPLVVIAIGAGWARDDPRGQGRLVGVRTVVLILLGIGWQLWWVWELLRFVPPADYPI